MPEKMDKLKQLVELFRVHKDEYLSPDYNEANVRVNFIDKFFRLLEWDMRNDQGYSEEFREVVVEDKLEIAGKQKAPDYSFRIGGVRKFFVEAKKPSINIQTDSSASFQLRRYAYTAHMPLSILTDFHEFSIYDTRVKPKINDGASVARVFYCQFDDYEKNFEYIYNLFSKSAIQKGSFNQYVADKKNKRGTSEVDKEFLKLIEEWRFDLAKNIATRNRTVDVNELNLTVQKIIDRIIFLRIAEDRNIEQYGLLLGMSEEKDIHEKIISHFTRADRRYDSELFSSDALLASLKIDDEVLRKVIQSLYYPNPYEFSVMPVEILGNIYEQFLGKVIHLTAGHQARIEEKPEVRKAGGVYYTPQYIVDYIVENTVGESVKAKKPLQVEKIKILDPACGSGSFLLGAYSYLLRWHLKYYIDPKNVAKAMKERKVYLVDQNNYKLTLPEKRRILLNNIYGVDIDRQAIEVSKLSLLLRLLEGENQESSGMLFGYDDGALLPDLKNNVKCGNSIVDSSYYQGLAIQLIGEDEINKINAFDWENKFPEIFSSGGFDIVIGNPPYLKEMDNKEAFEPIKKAAYRQYYQGKMDYWYFFLHRAIDVVKKNGLIGFITNSYFLKNAGASKLIDRICKELFFKKAVDLDDIKVFEGVSGRHIIHIYEKRQASINDNTIIINIEKENFINIIEEINKKEILYKRIVQNHKINFDTSDDLNFENCVFLGDVCDISQGVVEATSKISNKQAKNSGIHKAGEGVFVLNKTERDALNLTSEESGLFKPYLNNSDVEKYLIEFNNEYLIYSDGAVRKQIATGNYPNVKKHLDKMSRFITSSNGPYGLHRPRKRMFFERPKLVCKSMFFAPEFCYDDCAHYVGFSFSVMIERDKKYSLKYLLAILNSELGRRWFNIYGKKRGVGVDIGVAVYRQFPIYQADKNSQIEIVKLVDKIMELKKASAVIGTGSGKKLLLDDEAKKIENEIDKKIFFLYGLRNN